MHIDAHALHALCKQFAAVALDRRNPTLYQPMRWHGNCSKLKMRAKATAAAVMFTMKNRTKIPVLLALCVLVGFGPVACDHDCDSCRHDEPAAPYGLEAEVRVDGVALAWKDASDDEDDFIVERSVKDAAALHFLELVELPENTEDYLDTDVDAGLTYVYRIKAVNGSASSISDELEVILP